MEYTVKTFRAAGLEAKWGRNSNGAPIIFARDPQAKYPHQRESWWAMDAGVWKQAEQIGLRGAFDNATLLGDVFSVPA